MRLPKSLVRLTFFLLGVLAGGLVLPFYLAGEVYEYQDSVDGVHLPKVDAIVCLAGGRGRISAAGDLWYHYRELGQAQRPPIPPPLLYMSGVGPQTSWSAFTHLLRAGVREAIRPDDVFLEMESQNTEANAIWVARYAEKRGWKEILLITSAYHMKRAQFIFDHVFKSRGLSIHVNTLSAFVEPFAEGEWRGSLHGIHVTLLEYLKWIYTRYAWKP